MAKQIHGPLGGFVGKLGPLIGYRWRGRWCVRTRPQHVHNPRTEAQQRHRSLFRAEVQLAARMRWPIAMALTDEARRRHMTAQNLFVRLNHGLWRPADDPACAFAPDYSRLQLSTGRLEAVCGVRAAVDADGVLRVRFDRCRPEQRAYAYDEVFLYAYSPSAGAGYLFNSVYRRTGRIDVLPPDWLQTDDLQLYLMCRSSDGRWSDTVHATPAGVDYAIHNKNHNLPLLSAKDNNDTTPWQTTKPFSTAPSNFWVARQWSACRPRGSCCSVSAESEDGAPRA